MQIERVRLLGFRNHQHTEVELSPQITLVGGPNGHGKTNLLEAIDLLSGHGSFRGAQIADLIPANVAAQGNVAAQVRPCAAVVAQVKRGSRASTRASARAFDVELQLCVGRTTKAILNGNPLARVSDLAEVVQTVVFTPADLALVQGAPAKRRQLLDDIAGALSREYRQSKHDLDRVLRQRNALLKQSRMKQSRNRLDDDTERTLDVWDSQLVDAAEVVGQKRAHTVERLEPWVTYAQLAAGGTEAGMATEMEGDTATGMAVDVPTDVAANAVDGASATDVATGDATGAATGAATGDAAGAGAASKQLTLRYHAPWREHGLAAALAQSRQEDLRRGTTTVGPQRDDVVISVNAMPASTHCSQGEQRSVALALRLSQHRMLQAELGEAPVVLLDDVFSELDTQRAHNLISCLPPCQVIITSATGTLPEDIKVDKHVVLRDGAVVDLRDGAVVNTAHGEHGGL